MHDQSTRRPCQVTELDSRHENAEVEVPSYPNVAGELNIGLSLTVGDRTVMRVSTNRTHPEDSHVAREKKNMPGEMDYSLCPSCFFCMTPVVRHVVKYHLLCVYGSTPALCGREEEREENDGAEHLEMHQVFGASLLSWRRFYDIIQALVVMVPSEWFQTLDRILRVSDERILNDGYVLPKKQGMMDGHSFGQVGGICW